MEKIFGPLLQGTPGAAVIGIAFLLFIQPINTRLDQVDTKFNTRIEQMVTVMNREVIPVINELKKEKLPGPVIKEITRLDDLQRKMFSSLDEQAKRAQAVEKSLHSVVKNQEASAKEAQQERASVAQALSASQEQSRQTAGKFEEVRKQLSEFKASLEEQKKLVLSAAVSPYVLPYGPSRVYNKGDIVTTMVRAGTPDEPFKERKVAFRVTDARSLNAAVSAWQASYSKHLGLEPVEIK